MKKSMWVTASEEEKKLELLNEAIHTVPCIHTEAPIYLRERKRTKENVFLFLHKSTL